MARKMLVATMSGPRSHLADVPLVIIEEQTVLRGDLVEVREIRRQPTAEVWAGDEMMMYGADAQLHSLGYRRVSAWHHMTTLTWVAEVGRLPWWRVKWRGWYPQVGGDLLRCGKCCPL